jgi:hypothetical protein
MVGQPSMMDMTGYGIPPTPHYPNFPAITVNETENPMSPLNQAQPKSFGIFTFLSFISMMALVVFCFILQKGTHDTLNDQSNELALAKSLYKDLDEAMGKLPGGKPTPEPPAPPKPPTPPEPGPTTYNSEEINARLSADEADLTAKENAIKANPDSAKIDASQYFAFHSVERLTPISHTIENTDFQFDISDLGGPIPDNAKVILMKVLVTAEGQSSNEVDNLVITWTARGSQNTIYVPMVFQQNIDLDIVSFDATTQYFPYSSDTPTFKVDIPELSHTSSECKITFILTGYLS